MTMAKKRPRAGINTGMTADEAQEIGKKVLTPKRQKPKKEPSVKFNMRIPAQVNRRLEKAIEKTGLAKAAIILRALNAELSNIEQE